MLFILDKSFNVVEVLSNVGDFSKIIPYYDDLYTQDLVTGAETFEFTTTSNNEKSQHLTIGNYIAFKYEDDYKLFNIINITEDHNQTLEKTVYCEMAGIELINHIIRPMKVNNNTVKKFLDAILSDTDWQTGRIEAGLTQIIDFEINEHKSVYELIQEHIVSTFGAEIAYRVEISNGQLTGKYIDVYNNRGKENGYRFAYSKNIETISRTVDSSELVTALIGQGNNGLTFKDVDVPDKPINQDFIASETAYRQWNLKGTHLMGVHKCDTDSAHELLRLTRIALEERSQPKIKYEVKVLLIDKNIKIGDTVNIVDHEFNPPLYITGRVTQLKLSKTDPNKNECVLSNFKEVRSNITPEMRKLASQLEGYVDNQFPIGGDKIQNGAIGKDQFSKEYHTELIADAVYASLVKTEELIANKADIGELHAVKAEIEELIVKKADIEELNAINAKIENLKVNDLAALNATIENLKANVITAIQADIKNLKADKADISDLNALSANIDSLEAKVGKIDTLINGNLTSDNIHSLILTSAKVTVEDAFIKNAMIDSISATKINTGILNTNLVNIQSEDGSLILNGNLQQFKDKNGKVRIQMGKDAAGNFTFAIFDETGTGTLIDSTGVKAKAIGNGIIVNDMISNNASISGDKLDINSVVTSINNGTTTINSNKIQLNEKKQTLEVAFNSMSNTITEQGKTLQSHSTSINTMQGEIKTLISDTTIVEEGSNIKIKDAFSSLKQNIGEISSKISQVESEFDNVNANVQITVKSVKPQYYLSTSTTSCVGGSWQDTSPKWTQGKYMWQRLHYTYVNGTTSTGKETCIAGAVGDKGDKGDTGAAGAVGQSVISITPQYVAHTSSVTSPTSGWSDNCPAYSAGKFLWTRSKVVYANPSATKYTNPVYEPSWEAKNIADSASKTVTSKVAEFTQNLDGFKQTVSSTYATKETVTTVTNTANTANSNATNALNTANSANNKIDELEIGGENLVPNSDFYITTDSKTGLDMSIYKELFEKNRGKKITCSLDVKLVNAIGDSTGRQRVGMEFSILYKDGARQYIGIWEHLTTTPKTINTRISGTTTISNKEITSIESVGVYIQGLYDGSAQIGRPQVELGSKASNWKKSTRDIETEISSTKSKVSSIETNLSSITSRVSTVENKQTTTGNKVTSLETWKKSAEQKITDSAIVATVKSAKNTDGKNTFAQQSDITQLDSSWTAKFNNGYKQGIVDLSMNGIKVYMQDGEGAQGYTRIAHDGMEIFDSSGSRIAHFGDNNSAYIKSLTADKINNKHLLKWNEGRPTDLYIAPSATGDGTGRDTNNKANSITNALNWLWNTYGCYSWRTDIIVHVAPGDYWGADNYIGGWIGTGVLYIILEPWACLRDTIRVEECSMTVVIKGSVDPYNIEVQDNAYIILSQDEYGVYVRNSTVVIAGVNILMKGWYGDTSTWQNYIGIGVNATDGASVLVSNCDIVGFWYACVSTVSSYTSMLNCVGHVGCVATALDGGLLSIDRATPMYKDWVWRQNGGHVLNPGDTWASNSKFEPKPEAPQPKPPEPVEKWVWTENTFWASSLWTTPEGSGSGTSARNGQWGQGKWGSYKPHRGFAAFSGVNAWCHGGRNFTVELIMTRLNTSHGYGGAVPVPKIKTTNGSYWNCGKAFARGDTHTVTLPSDVANALVTGGWTQLEMWAGTSTNDYSFYDNVRIKVVCEKRVQ